MQKLYAILINFVPILFMIALIPLIQSDIFLTAAYILIIGIAFFFQYMKNDGLIFIFGFVMMTISEYFFISTWVEQFIRNSLFGIMPLWLPFIWGYGFVAIRRGISIIEK